MQKKTWLKVLTNIDVAGASLALVVLTILTFAGVFFRYVFRNPILWIEEIQAFCQVWVVFLGGSVAFRTGSHVAIEMVVDTLPEKSRKVMEYIIDFIVLCVLVYLCVQVQGYITQVFGKSGRPTPILRIPYALVYGIAPYGVAAMIISYFAGKYIPAVCEDDTVAEDIPDPASILGDTETADGSDDRKGAKS